MHRQQKTSTRLVHHAARTALMAALALPLSALALVGGAGVDPNLADSPWAGVGTLRVGSSAYTATLIAPGYILTAAHVAAGAELSGISFQTHAGTSPSYAASQVFLNPDYTASASGNVAGDPTHHADLAIIRLAEAVPSGIPSYSLFSGPLQGRVLSFVSYGGSASAKKTGENVADLLFANTQGVLQTYVFDYDGPDLSSNYLGGGTLGANREASLVPGDSGSAAFVLVNGQWQLAGINTFQGYFNAGQSSGQYGTAGGGVVLSSHASWISSVVLTPVPEPETMVMLLAGLGLVGVIARRRRL